MIGEPKVVHPFNKGDAVPDWLIQADPTSDASYFSGLLFAADGWIMEIGGEYFIVSDPQAGAVFEMKDAKDVALVAATKTVRVLSDVMACFPRGSGRGHTVTFPNTK